MKINILVLSLLFAACYGFEDNANWLGSLIRSPVEAHLLLHDGLNKVVDVIPPQIPGVREGARHFVNPHGEHAHGKRSIQFNLGGIIPSPGGIIPGTSGGSLPGTGDRDIFTTIARVPGDIHKGFHDGIGGILNVVPNVPVVSDLAKEYNDPTLAAGGHGEHAHGKRSIQFDFYG